MARRGRPPGAKTKRPRQPKLPTMENLSIAEIDEAAAEYVDARDNRMRLSKDEVKASTKLLDVMREHKLLSYAYDGFTVSVQSLTKVKVKRNGEEDGDGDG